MDKNIGILHLSDIHANKNNQKTIIRLVEQLLIDLQTLIHENNISIQSICITGDLIRSGDNADEEMDIVVDDLITPLLDFLQLSESDVYIVPGNHEVKRSAIVPYAEQGLASYLSSDENIRNFLISCDPEATKRISYFADYAKLFGGQPILDNGMCRSYLHSVGEYTIGFACVNSAWRSTGIGSSEKGKMVVGTSQIIDSLEVISGADIKVCMLHHPLDWLVDCDKNAVEKCIHQFDIVLNGHIHESSSKVYTTFNGHSLFNTCGKFDNSSDIYNGYSILSINPYNKVCDVFLRQYFDYPRNCFDKAIGLCTDGHFQANLGDENDTLVLAYNIVHSIKTGFIEYANKYFVSNVASGKNTHSFDEAFIPPLFSEYSDYEKETAFEKSRKKHLSSNEQIEIETICNSKDNLVLLGRKESGKTTAIHYLVKFLSTNFNAYKTVPIVIDCSHIDFAGKNVISRAAWRFITEFCMPDESFSQSNIDELLKAGLCTVMFDSLEMVNPRQLDKINAFIADYPHNRFIFCEKEVVSTTSIADLPVKPACDYKKYYLCSLTKRQIRTYTQKIMITECQEDKDRLVDKIILCFKNTSLPRTPFILSVILSLCDNSDYSPINEAVVLEQFMELLLGKHHASEAATRTYDFRSKEDFLVALVSEMHENNRYYLTYNEFSDFVSTYHTRKGFDIVETKFNQVFFDNGVLVRTDQIVRFRFNCMIEYYLAKKASQEPAFLKHIMENQNYIHYANELLYYTGLNRNSVNILQTVQADLHRYFDWLGPVADELKNYQIGLDLSLPEDKFIRNIEQSKLTQEQSDQLSDLPPSSAAESPNEINKTEDFSEGHAFIQSFFVFGTCLKNLEFIDRAEKEAAFKDYLLCLSIILAIMKLGIEGRYEKEIEEMEADPQKYTQEDYEKLKDITQDIIKIVLPISIQNLALENVGTVKLRTIYEEAIESSDIHDFSKFFSTFILCDLRVHGAIEIIQNYVRKITDKSLLTIVFFKLMYYYQLRYFSNAHDSQLESILADVNLKLQGERKEYKSHVIQKLKSKRLPEKDIK